MASGTSVIQTDKTTASGAPPPGTPPTGTPPTGTPWEVFLVFLKLGLTCFGGPLAHLGYFRTEFVTRRGWIGEAAYADLVALCQFLPGPTSSKLGFSLGVLRGGTLGGLAAWVGFTLPSAAIMLGFAYAAASFTGPVATGLIDGLKLVAVPVVAQAVIGMGRSLTPDWPRRTIGLAALALTLALPGAPGQIGSIVLGALVGPILRPGDAVVQAESPIYPVSKRQALTALASFIALCLAPFAIQPLAGRQAADLFLAFYRSGALVFGGGHVVLPLLQGAVVAPGWVSDNDFLAGYGVAQAVPGPMFSFAAYLGAVSGPAPNGLVGAAIATVAVFLPALLLVYGMLPFWHGISAGNWARRAMRGANAAVVGILAAAFITPVCTSAITGPADALSAMIGLMLLLIARVPSWLVVILSAAWGIAHALI
ncbi:MAG TPA: chromate efflux transporter [Stellaceae bacterium]|jgi:chromate transporter|nr:chromate efflux transporter [Stellaceae bacterium]